MDTGTEHNADPRILVIDDDPELNDALAAGLRASGVTVTVAETVSEGLSHLAGGSVDLLLLDLEVAGEDGMEVLRDLRARENPLPVIIMTGSRVETAHTVAGLQTGADDYVRKPFDIAELLARIRAVYRRHGGASDVLIRSGDLTIDRLHRRVDCRDRTVDLTLRELELLALLARHTGREVSRECIREQVWSDSPHSTTFDNTLDVHISRLRRKLAECESRCEVRTVWGKGFMLHAGTD